METPASGRIPLVAPSAAVEPALWANTGRGAPIRASKSSVVILAALGVGNLLEPVVALRLEQLVPGREHLVPGERRIGDTGRGLWIAAKHRDRGVKLTA